MGFTGLEWCYAPVARRDAWGILVCEVQRSQDIIGSNGLPEAGINIDIWQASSLPLQHNAFKVALF